MGIKRRVYIMGLEMLEDDIPPEGAVIKVVGVGGAGGNAVNHMIMRGVQGVEFIAMNTDKQALIRSGAPNTIQLGEAGLGAGANPEAGRDAARARDAEIRAALEGANMVFLTAGMGKGTGTGASPVVASIAKQMGILTVGVVTKPFDFEGIRKMRVADAGIDALVEHVDSLIVVLNQKLFEVMDEDATLQDAFKQADNVLHNAVAGIAEIINVPGLVNVDFSDVRTVMAEQGKAMMGIGEAAGMDRARIAAEQAVASPLLDGVDLNGARGVIVNITASNSLRLRETNEVINTIRHFCADDANIIHGTVFDDAMADSLRVTVVATGIGRPRVVAKPPVIAKAPLAVASAQHPPHALPRTGTYDAPVAGSLGSGSGTAIFARPQAVGASATAFGAGAGLHPGSAGATGTTGAASTTGSAGTSGTVGITGSAGTSGAVGITGSAGITGATGSGASAQLGITASAAGAAPLQAGALSGVASPVSASPALSSSGSASTGVSASGMSSIGSPSSGLVSSGSTASGSASLGGAGHGLSSALSQPSGSSLSTVSRVANAGLDTPTVWRDPRAAASARVAALEESGVERLDIPAFLRRQAD